jgi:hypothetical protein
VGSVKIKKSHDEKERSAVRSGRRGVGSALSAPPASTPGSAKPFTRKSSLLNSGQAESQVEAPVLRSEPAPVRRSRAARGDVPTPATKHAGGGQGGIQRVGGRACPAGSVIGRASPTLREMPDSVSARPSRGASRLETNPSEPGNRGRKGPKTRSNPPISRSKRPENGCEKGQ